MKTITLKERLDQAIERLQELNFCIKNYDKYFRFLCETNAQSELINNIGGKLIENEFRRDMIREELEPVWLSEFEPELDFLLSQIGVSK